MSYFFNRVIPLQTVIRNQPKCYRLISKNCTIYNNTTKIRLYCTEQSRKQGWSAFKNIAIKFIPIGLCLLAVMQWRAYRKYSESRSATNWEISCYCALPLRPLSRFWGWIAERNIPENLRPPVYGWYSKMFGVNIHEAISEDFKTYPCLGDFFARALKTDARKIEKSFIISPCDGRVLSYGIVKNGHIEQVKGVSYSLKEFLGYDDDCDKTKKTKNGPNANKKFLKNKDNSTTLYQCVLYLAPGDYHRFHSPTEWQPIVRKHFMGKLLSVNPSVASWIPGLFCLNERVSYIGKWMHGFFSYTAVGATNVGSIRVYFDESLKTNRPAFKKYRDDKMLESEISLKPGDCVGEFRFGSTIVLIFEAPKNFEFSLSIGQKILVGQSIGGLAKQKHVDLIKNEKHKTFEKAM